MDQQEAARAVLIEVVNLLDAFKDDIVGGWVPHLLFPGKNHIGSLDVDLAVRSGAVGSNAYSSILGRLRKAGYSHSNNPTRFYRSVSGIQNEVKVDLISGEYAQEERANVVKVGELALNALRGIDLAFEVCDKITIDGVMPDGVLNTVRAQIVRPEAFVMIKAFALDDRKKEKDAYDIAFVLNNYEPSLAALAANLAARVTDGLWAEAYQILTEKFATLETIGPAQPNGTKLVLTKKSPF